MMWQSEASAFFASVDNASAERLLIESDKTIYTWCLIIFHWK